MYTTAFLDLPPLLSAGGTVRLPGSKSISNRVLLLAALSVGHTDIADLLDSDDTRVMLAALAQLGCRIEPQSDGALRVHGLGGALPVKQAQLFLGNAGTAMRPLTAALALLASVHGGAFELSGIARMHERPIGDLVDALRQLGCPVDCLGQEGYPPLRLGNGVPQTLALDQPIRVRGDVSSQFLTALLLALPLVATNHAPTLGTDVSSLPPEGAVPSWGGPATGRDIVIEVVGELISRPYIEITLNLLARYSKPLGSGQFALTFMAYDNSWNAADQIPQRAVSQGLIDAFGSLDTSVGGKSSRNSVSASWYSDAWQWNAYAIQTELDLWSNFTYFLNDTLNGDQFEQVDERWIYGGELSRHWHNQLGEFAIEHVVGVQLRYDDIGEVGLYNTRQRQRLSTVRQDAVQQGSAALFSQSTMQLNSDWSAHLGLRYDYFSVDVNSDLAANSGEATEGIASLKAGLSYQFAANWQAYFNAGQGFHSNDARGATTVIDPQSGDSVAPVDLLVRSNGAELGLRFFDYTAFNISAALWYLNMDSELLYVGDAGTNEPSRASKRYGVEVAAYYWFNSNCYA